MVVRELDDEALQAVVRMLCELVEARGGSRPRTEAVRPRSTADLVTLLNAGVITLAGAGGTCGCVRRTAEHQTGGA